MVKRRNNLFNKVQLKLLRRLSSKLKEFHKVNSTLSIRKTLLLFSKRELSFLGECVYNFIFFGGSLVSEDIYCLFHFLFLKSKSIVRRNLYYFALLDASKRLKVTFGVKSYYLLVILILSLLPIFDLFLKKNKQ